ncbi:MAG: HAMP domain-containing sensor histidine kinase [Acidimicrobiia bacterium]
MPGVRWFWPCVIGLVIVLAALVVVLAGGTQTVWPHLFYVPVVLAALAFGLKGGLAVGILAGLVSGPFMPLAVDTGTDQPLVGWLTRLCFFAAIGMLAGTGRDRIGSLAEARQKFLSAISHELRTPLTAVLGFSEVVMSRHPELTPAEYQEFSALIHQEATELSNVIDHYVLEGRLDSANRLTVDVSRVDLHQVLDMVLSGIPPKIRESRVEVHGAPVHVDADPLRLRQVLRSLINHALAYGGECVLVEVERDARTVTVTVRDAEVGTIAAPYGRDATGIPAPPLGVGLAVARQLAVLMGGKLTYEMAGTTFLQLRLPATDVYPTRRVGRRLRTPE